MLFKKWRFLCKGKVYSPQSKGKYSLKCHLLLETVFLKWLDYKYCQNSLILFCFDLRFSIKFKIVTL